MKKITFYFSLFYVCICAAQSLPITFEGDITTDDFINFDGGTASVIANPQSSGINTSATVAQIIRDGGAVFAGSKIILDNNLDFTTNSSITMKVFTQAPVGTVVKFKLEGNGSFERDVVTTVSNAWETLTWDFTGAPANFNEVVFMFDFGNVGDGSATSTFLFDDVEQIFAGTQLDLPVTFDEDGVNYTLTDFEGNTSFLVTDPTDASNNVAQIVKPETAGSSAGTTIGTPAGFTSDIPLTLDDSKMTVRVWSPTAGTPVRLKVEDSNDPTHTCETETLTTTANEWEELEFDFTNEAPGTESLAVGLSMGWTFNMASIFFNFGTTGGAAGEQTYYFDDVQFGASLTVNSFSMEELSVYPNPSATQWTFSTATVADQIEIYDVVGKLLIAIQPITKSEAVTNQHLPAGIYVARVIQGEKKYSIRLIKM